MPRGILYGRGGAGTFEHKFSKSSEPSALNGLALDAYDQAYILGDITIGGIRYARSARIHQ